MSSNLQSFVIREEFFNLKNIVYGEKFYGKQEKQFDCMWRVGIYRNKGHLMYGLECQKLNDQLTWTLETCEGKLMTSTGNILNLRAERIDSKNYWKFTNWNQLRKLLTAGKLIVEFEIHIKPKSRKQETTESLKAPGTSENFRSFHPNPEVTLIVENQWIPISKQLLTSESTFFNTYFNKNKAQSVQLSNVKIEDFLEFIKVLFGSAPIIDENINSVLNVSNKYNFEKVTKRCETFLTEKSGKAIREKLEMATKYNLVNLKNHLKTLDDSDQCAISTDSLRCTVCYEIFPGIPNTIQCGHTFCSACINNLAGGRTTGYVTFCCPICRKTVNLANISPNYTLKDILDSIDVLAKDQESSRKPLENSLATSIERLIQQKSILEKQVDDFNIQIRNLNNSNEMLSSYQSNMQRTTWNLRELVQENRNRASNYKTLFYLSCVLICAFGIYQYFWSVPAPPPPQGGVCRTFNSLFCS